MQPETPSLLDLMFGPALPFTIGAALTLGLMLWVVVVSMVDRKPKG